MLTDQQVERYRSEGFLCPLRVLPDEDLRRLQAGFAQLEAEVGQVTRLGDGHRYFSWAYDLATHPRVLDTVEALLGPDLLICGTLVFAKYPHDPGFVAWHQDSVYSGWHLSPTTSAWIALSPSVPENGCMRVVPGSHLGDLQPHDEGHGEGNLLRRGEEIAVEVDEAEAHDLVLQPGEMSLHESNIIHGSRPNGSDLKRIGFIVRYVTPAYRPPNPLPIVRARGAGDCRHLTLTNPLPLEEDFLAAVARWQEATESD